MGKINNAQIQQGVHSILAGLGVDLADHNFDDTPHRYAKALEELFAPPPNHDSTFVENYTDFVLVKDHRMATLCPHHLLPVRMSVSIAYIPDGRVLGLSKLVRIMQRANSGPIMQERFTYAVRERLEKALETFIDPPVAVIDEKRRYTPNQKGICILVEGWHDCMNLRGVRSSASTITMATSGLFSDDQKMLDRFMFLVKGGR